MGIISDIASAMQRKKVPPPPAKPEPQQGGTGMLATGAGAKDLNSRRDYLQYQSDQQTAGVAALPYEDWAKSRK